MFGSKGTSTTPEYHDSSGSAEPPDSEMDKNESCQILVSFT